MQMPIADDTYDAIYTIEASCHAPDPVSYTQFLNFLLFVSIWIFIQLHTIAVLGGLLQGN